MPYDLVCWGLLDPTTLWPVTNRSTLDDSTAAIRAWDHELLEPDVLKVEQLVQLRKGAGALGLATDGDPARSARYRTVLEPMGVRDELRACCVSMASTGDGSRCFVSHRTLSPTATSTPCRRSRRILPMHGARLC